MNPEILQFDDDLKATLYYGYDVRESIKHLPDGSVHCVVTSPPYWKLRDYGVEGQIGLEGSPEAYAQALVEVFNEVKRVLRDDGTLWLNLGDSYANQGIGASNMKDVGGFTGKRIRSGAKGTMHSVRRGIPDGTKFKDLIGIPWLVAFAMRNAGWYLRADILWCKSNPMPESAKDRPTKAHEYVFLLSKQPFYYYDLDAIKEPAVTRTKRQDGGVYEARNRRSYWIFPVQAYKGSHPATMPLELAKLCILAGCPKGGTVLDPFSGSGTSGVAAIAHGRNYVGLDLNADYLALAKSRLGQPDPEEPTPESGSPITDLFGG